MILLLQDRELRIWIIIINKGEIRLGDISEQIGAIAPKDTIIIKSDDILYEFKKICDTPFVDSYTIGYHKS